MTLREDWPPALKRQLLLDLMKLTPRDLLTRHLAALSPTSASWLVKSRNFRESLAVTSVVGAVLGLGDRHLDNILVGARGGVLAHVDYNVCLGKG